MNIQSNVNQLLGMAAIVGNLPGVQSQIQQYKEKKAIEQGLSNLDTQQEALATAADKRYTELEESEFSTPELREANFKAAGLAHEQLIGDIDRKREALYKRRFELDPSDVGNAAASFEGLYNKNFEELANQQAMQNMRNKGTSKVKQKQKFKDFMDSIKNEPTSLGGKVKDLPEEIQRKIYEEYKK